MIEWAQRKKLPVVYEEHQTPDAQFDWWQDFHKSINKATRIVAVSSRSAEGLRTVCGVTRPIVVRPPLLADPMLSGCRSDPGSDGATRPPVVSTVARLAVAKGLKYLLEAVVRVQAVYPMVQFKVHGDGPLRQDLLERARELGLDGGRIFVGPFDAKDRDSIMAETDIFVMSSILEGQPLAIVEAMAYGRPIVTTDVGGIPELIRDGVNGLLCKPSDPQALAERICQLIENPGLRRRLGRAARRSYEEGSFQPADVSSHFISVYRQVIGEAHHPAAQQPSGLAGVRKKARNVLHRGTLGGRLL